jgi:hypothetical protein
MAYQHFEKRKQKQVLFLQRLVMFCLLKKLLTVLLFCFISFLPSLFLSMGASDEFCNLEKQSFVKLQNAF